MSGLAVSDFILSAFIDSIQGLLLRSLLVVEVDAVRGYAQGAKRASSDEQCKFPREALSSAFEYARKLGARIDFEEQALYDAAIVLGDASVLTSVSAESSLVGSAEFGDAPLISNIVKASSALKQGGCLLCVLKSGAALYGISNTETIATEKIFTFIKKVSNCGHVSTGRGTDTDLLADTLKRDSAKPVFCITLTYRMHFIHESCIIISFRKD